MVVRPEIAVSPLSLSSLNGGEYLVQPKFNGCFVEVLGGVLFNRHGQRFTKCDIRKIDLSGLDGAIGEYMDNGNLPMHGTLVRGKAGQDLTIKLAFLELVDEKK